MNTKTRTITAAAAIAATIALTGCGSTHAAPPATTAAVSTAAPSTPATPASTQPTAPSQADQIAAWATSPGYDAMQTVLADLTQLSTDADAEDMLATETDAATLAADAQTAENSPPPVGTGTYTAAMRDYTTAGNEAAVGDFADATVNMEEGTALVNRTTTAVNNAGS